MGGEIYQLTFVCSRRPDVQITTAGERPQLLAKLHALFAVANLTGLALVKGPHMLYYIEGAERDVLTLFAKIEGDQRVYGVVILRRRTSDKRAFAKWDFVLDADRGGMAAEPLVDHVTELVANAPMDIAQEFLGFARLEQRANAF